MVEARDLRLQLRETIHQPRDRLMMHTHSNQLLWHLIIGEDRLQTVLSLLNEPADRRVAVFKLLLQLCLLWTPEVKHLRERALNFEEHARNLVDLRRRLISRQRILNRGFILHSE